MKKTNPTKKPFALHLDTIRTLSDDSLAEVDGATSDNSNLCLMCPSRTWSGSKRRTIMY
jgi:hypothetical protein